MGRRRLPQAPLSLVLVVVTVGGVVDLNGWILLGRGGMGVHCLGVLQHGEDVAVGVAGVCLSQTLQKSPASFLLNPIV